MAVKLNGHDLQFILNQIKIAEAHANGIPLTEIRVDANGIAVTDPNDPIYDNPNAPRAIPDPKTPFGLRTVDGSYNNLVEGREFWGAADQTMPRLLDPSYRDGGPENPFNIPGMGPVSNTDYDTVGNPTPPGPTSNGGHTGNVVDTDPRVISNLVVDMSLNNPAAIAAAFKFAGSEDPLVETQELLAARVTQAQADAALADAQTALTEAQGALADAVDAFDPLNQASVAALQAAAAAVSAAQDAVDTAQEFADDPVAAFRALAIEMGLTVDAHGSLVIPNVAPDEGISAPFNAWMTFFGQFFDHGLDLITKGGNGTIFIPLNADDPLVTHGPDGIAGSGDEVPASMRFMVLTRATPVVGEDGSVNHTNTTTPFVDQNQTYTSHASHQVFLREYKMVEGKPIATGKLLDGADGGLPTWAEVKHQAATVLGIQLTDGDVLNIPLLRTDAYGEFIRGPNGLPQIVVGLGPDGTPNTADDIVVEGNLTTPVNTFASVTVGSNTYAGAIRIGHAFMDDIAHAANPLNSQTGALKTADADDVIGQQSPTPLALSNNTFEADSMETGAPGVVEDTERGNYAFINPQGWQVTGFAGVFDPTDAVVDQTGHEGNVVFLDDGATLVQDTGIALEAGKMYRLTFNVGERLDQSFGGGTARLLTDEGDVLATMAIPTPADGQWGTVTLTTAAVSAANAGEFLRIEIVQGGASGSQVLIDDVQLSWLTQASSNTYDDELLDRHFITGDGRGNENFGLTAVHHVFHSEHNRQVHINKISIIDTGDLDFINEWLVVDLTEVPTLPTDPAARDALLDTLSWDGERLFQTARFATEMQYQHLVFEEFARKVQPAIDPFVFNSVTDINPAIFSEFANTVYRFGHSMLTDSMPRIFVDPETGEASTTDEGLIAAFLNPLGFDLDGVLSHEQAAGAIVRGLTGERGNEIDEFVVNALRNNLLGLPLDLAAINIARGRDTGVPTLNEAREQLFAATNSSFLKPYASWTEFAAGLKNPLSVVNFIAAYGTHAAITGATTLEGKRAAAMELVFGVEADGDPSTLAGRSDFLNGTGIYAAEKGGLDNVDLWIGGLAEKILLFGGMLGSTFNAVFEAQMENLQDADRFYYLTRTQGLHFLQELENNAFSKLIMANTDLTMPGPDGIRGTPDDIVRQHIGVDSFTKYDYVLEADEQYQLYPDPVGNDSVLEGLGLGKVVRDMPASFQGFYDNYLRFYGGEHVVLGGTAQNDVLIGDLGDEGIWGGDGDDFIEGGQGVDLVLGGGGDDIILDEGDVGDFLKGEEGDDVIANSNGIDILMGGSGKDAIFVGVDDTEVFAGEGDDFVLGGDGVDLLMGNEGDDWIEGGLGFDTIAGDNSELFFNSNILGHDVMFAGSEEQDFDAESGDDIMIQGESVIRNEGMFGFDWATFQGAQIDGYADMRIKIFTTEAEDILRNRFDKTEALSGSNRNDTLIGDDRIAAELAAGEGEEEEGGDAPVTAAQENVFFNDQLSQAGVDRIDGLRALLGSLVDAAPVGATPAQLEALVAFDGGNFLLGGGGSDTLQGNGGDDFVDGDHLLNVRIRITVKGPDGQGTENSEANEIATVTSLKHTFEGGTGYPAAWEGKSLFELMVARTIVPSQLHIVREILNGAATGDEDTAVFSGLRTDYLITRVPEGPHDNRLNIVDTRAIDSSAAGDIVQNVEWLQFGDGTRVSVADILGQPFDAIRITYDELDLNGTLTAVPQPNTPDAVAAIQSYVWQILGPNGIWINIPGATAPSFTPDDTQRGQEIRVQAFYLGGSVISTETALVGDDVDGAGALVDDDIEGTEGSNLILGLDGDDRLEGNEGNDILDGGLDNDRVDGGIGDDTVRGGVGDDDLIGRAGFDTLEGGIGDDTITGGHDDDLVDGGAGTDTAGFEGPIEAMFFERDTNGNVVVSDNLGAEGDGRDTLISIEQIQVGETDLFTLAANGTAAADIVVGTNGSEGLAGLAGDDLIFAGGGNDTVTWNVGHGRDFIDGGAGADDHVVVNGNATAETFVVYARSNAIAAGFNDLKPRTEIVITRDGQVVAELDNVEEITINTGGGGGSVSALGDFLPTSLNISTITINGGSGNDVVDVTGLQSSHRIVFRSFGGDDTIVGTLRPQDVIELPPGTQPSDYTTTNNGDGTSTLSNGTHSITFAGTTPPTTVPAGGSGAPGGFHLTASDLAGLKALVNGEEIPGNDDAVPGVRELSGYGNNEGHPSYGNADELFIRITDAHYGAPDGNGNRAVNPIYNGLDARDISNILGTQEANLPHAENEANIFFMAFGQYVDHGLDFIQKGGNGTIQIGAPGMGGPTNPADLSRATVAGLDSEGNPQHINKTSPFVDQNQAYGSNSVVGQFLRESDGDHGFGAKLFSGAPDPSNPEFNLLPTLRELIQHHWDNNTTFTLGNGTEVSFRTYYSNYTISEGVTGDLLDANGAFNPMVVSKLAANFMGSGHALILDSNPFMSLLDHYVAGDGRANENFALTSVHTIWARNHNFHVDNLRAQGFDGTDEEVFQAAKMINEAEYQRVVFDEYADTLLGGMKGLGTHGHDEYDPNADASISHEFAAAAFRFGHSLVTETLTVLDQNGQPMQVRLFDAFLNPTNDASAFPNPLPPGYTPQPGYEQLGVNAILGGSFQQASEAVDFNIVDAVRNDLVRISADLFAFNVARARDVGLGTLNQVRAGLIASQNSYVQEAVSFAGNLNPYTSWEDFQARNGLSNAVIEQFKQAYPDLVLAPGEIAAFQAANPGIQLVNGDTVKGIDRVDLWVGGLAEQHVNGGVVGQTFWVILHEQFDRLQDADRFYYTERFDNFDLYENHIDGQEFSDIVARNTGMTDLDENIFRVNDEDDSSTGGDDDDDEDEDDDDDTTGGDDDDDEDDDDTTGGDDDDEDDDDDDDDTTGGDDDDDDDDTTDGDDDDDDDTDTPTPPTPPVTGEIRLGTPQADALNGTAGDDTMSGLGDNDVMVGGNGDDVMSGGEGDDIIRADGGRDTVFAGAGNDDVFGGSGADMLYGDAGADRIIAGEGDDFITPGTGNDTVFGGAGNDLIVAQAGDGNDTYYGEVGDDILDMSAITTAITADLGTGLMQGGSVSSSESGTDTIWGIETIVTGSGNDVITAGSGVNVMDGRGGSDTYKFLSASDANGDTIASFQPGDKIDLSAIDAVSGTPGNQAFVLVNGGTAAGQLAVSHQTQDGEAVTVIEGHVNGDQQADFKVTVKGTHELNASDFNL